MMIKKLIPHIFLILTLVALTMFILTQFNPGILFMDFYKVCMYAFCIVALIASGLLIAYSRRD